jgi:hypothetical protein
MLGGGGLPFAIRKDLTFLMPHSLRCNRLRKDLTFNLCKSMVAATSGVHMPVVVRTGRGCTVNPPPRASVCCGQRM